LSFVLSFNLFSAFISLARPDLDVEIYNIFSRILNVSDDTRAVKRAPLASKLAVFPTSSDARHLFVAGFTHFTRVGRACAVAAKILKTLP